METFDILLCIPPISQINSPYVAIPLLSAFLSKEGFTVTVSDANINYLSYLRANDPFFINNIHAEQINDKFLGLLPENISPEFTNHWVQCNIGKSQVFGFGITSKHSLPWALTAAKMIKGKNPKALIIFGGALINIKSCELLLHQNNLVDVMIIGEGENTLLEVLNRYFNNGKSSLKNIPGTAIQNEKGNIYVEPRKLIENLDMFPFPDYSVIPIDEYLNFQVGTRTLPILGSRGCIGKCTFCSERERWGYFRFRSAESVVSEIKYQFQNHNIKIFRFNDSLLNGSIKRLEMICDLLVDEKMDIYWVGNVRANKGLSGNLLRKMRESGCRVLWFGIESASPRILKIMNKGIDITTMPKILRDTKEAGIMVLTFWITHFPKEEIDDTQTGIEFFREFGKYIDIAHFTDFNVHLDSIMYKHPENYSILIKGLNEFGEPIWEYKYPPLQNRLLLKSIADIYTTHTKLPWDFVGII